MTTVAVVAHAEKGPAGGLERLRSELARHGVSNPLWYEVKKSRKAPPKVKQALADGADVLFVWGGDGTVQRCIDVVAGSGAAIAIVPVGTANLLATSLGLPTEIDRAVAVGLHGARRTLDTGVINGEHFSVMAGAGFDARTMAEADRNLKGRIGRAAYAWTGARNLSRDPVKARIKVDGKLFFKGRTSCVLVGNVGEVVGSIKAFPEARPDDGILDVGVVTASTPLDWARVLGRVAVGSGARSKFVESTTGHRIRVRFSQPVPYELDGGARGSSRKLRIDVHPGSVEICVPDENSR
jgi:YegS/Rv2252/BmrU family lipid kinase